MRRIFRRRFRSPSSPRLSNACRRSQNHKIRRGDKRLDVGGSLLFWFLRDSLPNYVKRTYCNMQMRFSKLLYRQYCVFYTYNALSRDSVGGVLYSRCALPPQADAWIQKAPSLASFATWLGDSPSHLDWTRLGTETPSPGFISKVSENFSIAAWEKFPLRQNWRLINEI